MYLYLWGMCVCVCVHIGGRRGQSWKERVTETEEEKYIFPYLRVF